MTGREPPPLAFVARRAAYPWFVVGTVCIGAFMGQVDASVTQLLLPILEGEFHAGLDAVSWVSIAYLLSVAAFLPIFGRLADMLGRKLLYIGGFLVFVAGSALCGLAPTLAVLVACRILQALGAALLGANSLAIVVTSVGRQRRGRAIGVQAAAQAMGLSAGPALGGVLLHALGWRWVFWINVPVGILGAALAWIVLPQTTGQSGETRFDWWGALLIAPALAAFVLTMNEARAWGLASPAFLGCGAATALLLGLFIWRERRAAAPLLDLDLFRRHAIWAGNLAGLLAYAMLFGVFFLMPFVFERAYHESSLSAGLRLTAIPLALGVAAPASGAIYDRLGSRAVTAVGMATCLAAVILLLVTMNGTPHSLLIVTVALALFGAGEGLFAAPNNSSIMGAAPPERTGEAGSVLNVMRNFGTGLGIAAASSLLAWRLAARTGHAAPTTLAAPGALLSASHDVLLLLAAFAAAACAISLIRPHHQLAGGVQHSVG